MENTVTRYLLLLASVLCLCACGPSAELVAAKNTIAEQEAKIALLQQESAAAKTEIASLTARLDKMGNELDKSSAQLAKKPDLPISVSVRKALTGPGLVAVFNTTIKSSLAIMVSVTSTALGTTKAFEVHLNPAGSTELGHLEGAVIEPGDTITVENNNFAALTYSVPSK